METELDFHDVHIIYRAKIHRYLTRLAGEQDAEDLTQEVFIKVRQALKKFRGESLLSTWIYRIATNVAIDRKRSPSFKQRARTIQVDDPEELEGRVIWIGEATRSPLQQVEHKEMNECIRGFVENLPESYRTVLVLSELEEMKNSEIADILGVTLGTVKIRLHRAKEALRKELQARCDFSRNEENEFACDLKRAFAVNE